MYRIIAFLVASLAFASASISEELCVAGVCQVEVQFDTGSTEPLPEDAQAYVQLLDVSLMDVAAAPIAGKRIAVSELPMTIDLLFDPAVIDERFTYVATVEIISDRKRIYRNTQSYPVLTKGAQKSVSVMLDAMQ
ncbi:MULTISPECIES: YbaY family lipoprotein [Halocynthiibacter]|uniref:YbaY family lipoprotein n=1 Tax=Halocynthiibacter halioticoli TaxID=2986804 RepID=A0AAE3LUU1_9RHOB|nr:MULTISPECIES: YbaY family lipoprotein [Halocynthiibacter]MCV6825825.1 YbaY family lipoprotein [Halocynthiibacter halioticoli]MCW4058826.1 YbaY family lipoprotein [Halocynthiibacter sp. SDUM655004]